MSISQQIKMYIFYFCTFLFHRGNYIMLLKRWKCYNNINWLLMLIKQNFMIFFWYSFKQRYDIKYPNYLYKNQLIIFDLSNKYLRSTFDKIENALCRKCQILERIIFEKRRIGRKKGRKAVANGEMYCLDRKDSYLWYPFVGVSS